MLSISMIFTVLATAALAKGAIECSFSNPTGVQQCFGAVGQLLIFHLSNTANTDITLKKDDEYIIFKRVKNKTVTLHEDYMNQPEPFTNGSIKLGYAMKRHSGDYQLEEFGFNGVLLKKVNVNLEIQAPVSKPAVSQMCLSPEEMNISCSSEGDEVELILTLDNVLLMRTRGQSQSLSNSTTTIKTLANSTAKKNKSSILNITISLHKQLTGNVMCQAFNNCSRDETIIHVKSCKVSSFHLVTVAVTASVVVLLLLAALCLLIIKLHNKPRPTNVTEANSEDEIIYADVTIMNNTRKNGPNSHQNTT
ncbi:uncharacterized protein LOC121952918 isoform X2 [Plectropomus leopardus]|uniref:uncharacterized protein LOC121952918 isoform X2 n=1 Tax=Plectropomus leopardus TaxID=160734 RepID=UPI001C4C5AC8|nr:uncharacterized protein LOC121952918 isoform X2 [Plectropomus leopardus]